jgi:outer membrane cobalamin receptor
MSRPIHLLSRLFVLLTAVLVPAAGSAQTPIADAPDTSGPAYQLDLIITSAFRETEDLFSRVERITARDLRERGITTVAQALDLVPGLRTGVARVGHGSYVTLRGLEQQNLLIVVDGAPLYTPFDGLVELDQLPVDRIRTIRVIKGSAPLHYGPAHLGGVIDIVTRETPAGGFSDPSENPTGAASVLVSENGTYGLRLGAGWGRGPWRMHLTGSRDRSDGFRLPGDYREAVVPALPGGQSNLHYENGGRRDNSDHARDAAILNASYAPGDRWRIDLSAGLVDNRWGVPPHPIYNPEKDKSRVRYWRFQEWKQTRLGLTVSGRLNDRAWLRADLFHNTYRNVLDGYDDDTYSTQNKPYAFHSTYDDHALGGKLRLDAVPGRIGRMTLCAGFTADVHTDIPDRGEPAEEVRHRTWWCSLEDQAGLSSAVSVTFGCSGSLLEKVQAPGEQDPGGHLAALDPRLSLTAAVLPAVRLYLNAAGLSRFPTMKQLYGIDGDPDLKTQRCLHLELGGRWTATARLRLEGSVFFDRIRDLIEGNYTSSAPLNIPRAVLTGVETGLRADPLDGLHGRLSYLYLRVRNRSAGRPGDDLQYRPRHQLDWRLWAGLPLDLFLDLSGSVVSERAFYNDFYGGRRDRLAAYAVTDLTIRKIFSFGLELFTTVENLSDDSFSHVFSSPAPGRQMRGGFNFSW